MPWAAGQQPVRHSAEALLVSTGQGEALHPQGITALAKIGRKKQGGRALSSSPTKTMDPGSTDCSQTRHLFSQASQENNPHPHL